MRSEQKKLDRPELREIDEIVVKIWNMARRVSSEGYQTTRIATLEWARGEILALIPDIEEAKKQGYRAYAEKMSHILPGKFKKCRNEAKKQERERIIDWGFDICILHGNVDERIQQGRVLHKGQCYECWQALKEEKSEENPSK